MWTQIIMIGISMLISYALRPKPEIPDPATLKDFDIPTASEGDIIVVVFGEEMIEAPNVIYYGDLSTQEIWSEGGKK